MHTLPFIAVIIVLVAGTGTSARAADISQLAWLGGCWKSDTAEPGSGEHWLPLAGGTLLGVSRTVKQGKTVEFEFMQIRAAESGQLAFIAMPSGQKTVVFPLLRLGETEVVFENPQHDFPQRVIYQVEGETKLRARIEGMRKGALRVIEFPMNRVSCDSQLKLP
ncbi:DUF6265 family protein [Xanthomonas arboricola]|uniref:DUF6265 family protein n=1 Tax=Xanthomonas arboricola TaxID=56448 RepID=UPI001189F2E2|nr:DUF6265 family protein [Xanthomonas arboricola]NJC28711.1 hypothetical protein [Xanthomonas arboricola]QDS14513.1 hypothetical protein FPL04_01790 [Xanthomonas arboricola]